MSVLLEAIQISFLAMIVIFLVLGILIGVIKVLVHFLPYVEEPAPPARTQSPVAATGASQEEEHIAAIHAVLAHHLGKAPQDIHIQHITSL
ncbi:MAG: OadG family protein [Nitrospinae bacterium]|nr:OadG family protein [Nitrospinota bacterium]